MILTSDRLTFVGIDWGTTLKTEMTDDLIREKVLVAQEVQMKTLSPIRSTAHRFNWEIQRRLSTHLCIRGWERLPGGVAKRADNALPVLGPWYKMLQSGGGESISFFSTKLVHLNTLIMANVDDEAIITAVQRPSSA